MAARLHHEAMLGEGICPASALSAFVSSDCNGLTSPALPGTAVPRKPCPGLAYSMLLAVEASLRDAPWAEDRHPGEPCVLHHERAWRFRPRSSVWELIWLWLIWLGF